MRNREKVDRIIIKEVKNMKKFIWLALGLSLMASMAFGAEYRPLFWVNGEISQLGAADTMYHSGPIKGEQIEAWIADGTAPLIVASTTLVDNLNVQYLNSIEANAVATATKLYPLDGDAKWPIGVHRFDTTKGLEDSAGNLAINIEDSDPTLKFVAGELGVKLNAAGGLETGASGVGINLEASDPSLQISSNELGVKIKAAGGLAKDSDGLYIADLGGAALVVIADTSALAVGDVVYINGNGTVAKADATDNTKKAIGIVSTVDASGKVVLQGRVNVTGGIVANTLYFLGIAAGTYTDTAPSANGNIAQAIARGWDEDELLVDIHPSITIATD